MITIIGWCTTLAVAAGTAYTDLETMVKMWRYRRRWRSGDPEPMEAIQ